MKEAEPGKGLGSGARLGSTACFSFPSLTLNLGRWRWCLLYIPGDRNEKTQKLKYSEHTFLTQRRLKKKKKTKPRTQFITSGIQKGLLKKAYVLGYPLEPFSIKVTMNCTFWGGKGECQRGDGRDGG